MRSVLFFLLLPTLAFRQSSAQSSTPRPEDLGTVTGHITCADTQRPTRLAEVRLISVLNPIPYPAEYRRPSTNGSSTGLVVHTDLTGGYTITGVQPGQYYLRVVLPGYSVPIVQFTQADFKTPTPEVQQRIQHELQLVTVAPNSTTQADATLQRGASISGTVTFDDGSPAIAVGINLLHRDANAKLQLVRDGEITFTDGRGEFRIEALSPGEYVVEARLATFSQSNGKQSTPDESVTSFLAIYSGNVFRRNAATVIKIDAGQEIDDADINIPLSRLHEISGTILAKDGHSPNADTRIDLLDPDTRELVARTWAHSDGSFQLHHVPEGAYTLRVVGAMDWSQFEVRNPPGSNPPTHTEYRTLRTYGDLSQPLTVQTDTQSLILTVPDKPATSSTE